MYGDRILIGSNVQEIKATIKQLKTEFKTTVEYKPKMLLD